MEREEIRRWVAEVLEPLLAAKPGKGDLPAADAIRDPVQFKTHPQLVALDDLGQVALLSTDVDRVKDYVFESDKLPEIRGGSQILENLESLNDEGIGAAFKARGLPTEFVDDDPPGCIAYAAGGSLLAVVPPELADALCRDIEQLYAEKTGAATISCVCQKLSPLELLYGWKPWQAWDPKGKKDFGEIMQLQGLLLRRRKQEKPARPFFEALPVMRRCASCEIRPAQKIEMRPEPRHLCWVCHRKAEHSEKGKWTHEFENLLRREADALDIQQYLASLSIEDLAPDRVKGAQDIGEIAEAFQGRYVGFIYADGNGIGRQIELSHSLREYRRKSQILLEEIHEVVYTALRRHLTIRRDVEREIGGTERKVDVHPFEIITIGGDDMLLIVPGDAALPIALDICGAFEKKLEEYPDLFEDPAMSAGVMIADVKNPIYFMHDLAQQLLKSAKQRSAEEGCGGTVDFLALKSQSMLDRSVKSARSHAPLQRYEDDDEIRLTARPLTLEEARRLIQTTQVLRKENFSRGQLIELRRALRMGRLQASLHYLYQLVRYPKPLQEAFVWIEREWDSQPLSEPLPWKKKDGSKVYWTFWEDVADLWDFVPELSKQEWEVLKQEIHPPKGADDGS